MGMKKVIDDVVTWLAAKVKETGVKGLVVGVSGGLDSAVVAHLIQKAAPDASLGVIMPLNTKEQDIAHARKVINSSDIKSMMIDLTDTHQLMFKQVKEGIKDEFDESHGQLADANLRARLRMSTLYTIATNYNYLVVGTDNASEYYTGYFTKYGDGGVDILPIVEYTKKEIRKRAVYLDVPSDISLKKPSADLCEGETDEEEIGTTDNKIDDALKGKEIPAEDKKIIETMHVKTAHKREYLPKYRRDNSFN